MDEPHRSAALNRAVFFREIHPSPPDIASGLKAKVGQSTRRVSRKAVAPA
jgi:hypothetical protein